MLTSTRSRLSFSHLIVLLIGMGLAAGFSWMAVERLYLDTQRQNLLAQASLTANALAGMPLPAEPSDIYLQSSNIAPGIHTRLLDEQGAVLVGLPLASGDVPVQVPLAENNAFVAPGDLLQRPEIEQALDGQAATAVRRVPTADDRRVLYAAAPVWVDGQVAGIAYLATPLPPTGLPTYLVLQLMAAVLSAMLLAWIAGTILSRRITHPLQRLDRAATAVSAGDLNQRVPVSSNIRELDHLGQAFNRMTDDLRQADQTKTTFIADVTHELRTPLTVIKGTIETLEDGALDDLEGRSALLASMHQETDRLIRLVNDLLVLTRSDAGMLNLDLQPVNLIELAQTRCARLASLAARRQVILELAPVDTDVQKRCIALGDADRLAQIFDNLLDNAIRHTRPASRITITIKPFDKLIQSEVRDQGDGIPVNHLPYIFERFYRVSKSRDRQSGGSGLGLTIVRALVKAQGGHITADSIEGQGTVFTFWLPAAQTDTELPQN